MRMVHAAVACSFFLGSVSPCLAEDSGDAKAVIEKAQKAVGGADKLAKPHALTFKFKGVFSGLADPIDLTGESAVQMSKGQHKMTASFEFNGNKLSRSTVLNGNKGWIAFMGNVEDMNADQLAEAKEGLYAMGLADLTGIKGVKLTPLGESKVGTHAVVGFKATKEGHKDVKLFFDKDTGLVVKTQRTAKDAMTGEDQDLELYLEDYKEWPDGVRRAVKQVTKRNGKDFLSTETTEYKTPEKLDDKVFGKPES